jgi:type IX secretion system substrate protein
MKSKIFTLTMLFAFVASMNAQTVIFEEDFESSALIPDTFTLIENDGFTPNDGDEMWTDSAWTVVTSSRPELEGTQVAAALSYYTDMGDATADDWMILPAINLGSASTLSWDAMSLTSSGNYPDDYQVIIAEVEMGTVPTVDYMFTNGTILLDQDAEWTSAGVSNPGDGIHHHEIDLADYADQEVWIAFRQNTGNGGGYLISIDNIKIVDGSGTGVESLENSLSMNIYPNPASEVVNIKFSAEEITMASLSVYDITGRMVKEMNLENLAFGINNIELDVTTIQTGTYIVTLNLNSKVYTHKLMIQ